MEKLQPTTASNFLSLRGRTREGAGTSTLIDTHRSRLSFDMISNRFKPRATPDVDSA